jgi:hypothetical protein
MSKRTMLIVGVAAVVLAAAGAGKFALAQQPQGDVIGELANNEGIFVDGKTFKIARGKAKGDPPPRSPSSAPRRSVRARSSSVTTTSSTWSKARRRRRRRR